MTGYASNSEHLAAEGHTGGRFEKGRPSWNAGKRLSSAPMIVEPSGHVRSAVEVECVRCGRKVMRRADRPGRFCGIRCSLENAREKRAERRAK